MPDLLQPPLPAKQHNYIRWDGLYGDALALAISSAAQDYAGISMVITQDIVTAQKLQENLHFFQPKLTVYEFPDWETLPYDNFSPHQDIISQRLSTLYHLSQLKHGVLIVPINTAMQRLTPTDYVSAHSLIIKPGDKLDLQQLRLRLDQAGYRAVSQVLEHGEFAVRGSLFDIFPMGTEQPLRVDLLGDEVDSIRTFDPESQRSLNVVANIHLLPAREFPLTETHITLFRQQWREKFSGNPANCPVYQDVSQGLSSPGIEYYLPLFFPQLHTLFDYLPESSLIINVGNLVDTAETFWQDATERYEQRSHDITRPILAPTALYLRPAELLALCKNFKQIKCQTETDPANNLEAIHFATLPVPNAIIDHKAADPLYQLKQLLQTQEQRILLCAESAGRREALLDLLKAQQLAPVLTNHWQDFLQHDAKLQLTIAPLEQGLNTTAPAVTVLTENQLFGQQRIQQRRRKKAREYDTDAIVRNLAELQIGTAVVHIEHGVGRYLGLQLLTINQIPGEYLTLEYAGGDKLYVPVSALHLISRYSGAELEHAPLHRLGSDQWQKAKRKASEKIYDVAAELLAIHAQRAARQGFMYEHPRTAYEAFAASFAYEVTSDQATAISAVINDMTQGKAMDRLVCGDVGFGKTEVAMRAAFIAVQNSKQVAVLVPTTLLAQQHYENFKDRFADWPVRVEVLSRFRSNKEQQTIIEQLKTGKIDILIGTHKLIQSAVQFKQLGLIIIDEEHRFGVRQKERLKSLRAEVDILTLTATPIPRTLNMSLAGMRDLSIIATPPARRLAIKTFVREYQKPLIREAILREIMRGGQVFYLYNVVESIERAATELATLVPEARVSIAHGQMHERDLERIMADFYHHRSNVLVCSTIIETGIDIPAANTIIIDRADKFGLAQLHQLRGRVGRSHHQAYAYLLIPSEKTLTSDAKKRLDAIEQLEDLGVGFTLATHDLEIRGAGELLGEEQSGSMQAIGFSLYMELLERAVNSLKKGEAINLETDIHNIIEIKLPIPALLPDDYVPDVHTRLILYKRLASAQQLIELDEIQVELIDRFGLLPDATKNLVKMSALKITAQILGIIKIDAGFKGGRIEFSAKPNIDPIKIIKLIQTASGQYKLDGPHRLKFVWDKDNAANLLSGVENLLTELS